MKMKYRYEKDMYPHICHWLNEFLGDQFHGANIAVHDLSKYSLSRFIATHNIAGLPDEWVTWDIKVDIVAFIQRPLMPTSLIFAECKNVPLTLAHLSQLLGYSRIAQPTLSFLLSPLGFSSALISLLREYRRYDVLEYWWEKGKVPRRIIAAQWDINARNIDRSNIIGGDGL